MGRATARRQWTRDRRPATVREETLPQGNPVDVRYRVPPSGPALDDHATQVALRRYRAGPWLLVLAGVALLGEVIAGTAYDLSQPVQTPLGNVINILTGVAFSLGLLLLIPGLIYSVKARRWRRVLAEHAWRAVRYHYTERVSTTVSTTVGSEGTSTSVLGRLRILDPSAADGTSPRWVNFDSAWTPWGKWRLRPWRQARKGVAWIAGDLSGALVVALPGPGRLFGAPGGHWASGLVCA